MITHDDVINAMPELTYQQQFLSDLLRRGAEVIDEEPLPNMSTPSLSKEITFNMQRGSRQNHTNYLMQEIENGIEIVERALDRARLLLRARPEIYSDIDADLAAEDIIAHQNIAQSFLTQISNLTQEDLSRLSKAQPEDSTRLPRVQRRAVEARYDFEMVTDYIERSAVAGSTFSAADEELFFDYARRLPENPREAYIDGCLELGKLFTSAVEYTSRRMDSLLELLDLNRMGFIPLKLIPEDDALKDRVEMQREYRAAQTSALQSVDIAKGYFIQALNFTA